MGLMGLTRRRRHERTGFELYGAAVAAARDPWFYTDLGVPDTLDGRFDMVALHVFLVIDRLTGEPTPGPALAQAVFDAMFSDMDINLREMGVGDMSIGRKVRQMWEAFHGRSAAYSEALKASDQMALRAALVRNVWRGAEPAEGAAEALARYVLNLRGALAGQTLAALDRGQISFPVARE